LLVSSFSLPLPSRLPFRQQRAEFKKSTGNNGQSFKNQQATTGRDLKNQQATNQKPLPT